MNTFYALAIDGGGMRGYYTATLIDALCRRFNEGNAHSVDIGSKCGLICGTSTGAILACALVAGIPLPKIMDMYKTEGKNIFPNPIPNSKLVLYYWLCRHLKRNSAKAEYLHQKLKEYFQNKTLGEIYKERQIALCVASVDARNYKAWVFKTPHISGKNRDNEYKITDVCMASSAVPILFPIHAVDNPGNRHDKQYFVDGGIWINCPILMALIEALQIAKPEQDIAIISAGTVSAPNGDMKVLQESPRWGILNWKGGREIMEMSISAQSYGYNSMAIFLAKEISKMGRKIEIISLNGAEKSPQKYGAIGIDKSDETAIATMAEMAETDASHIHSKNLNCMHMQGFFTQ